jgi:hypothetical protein
MNEPPSPSGYKQCFNCGKDLETHVRFCPHCGVTLLVANTPVGVGRTWRIIGAILLFLMALTIIYFVGVAGACLLTLRIGFGELASGSSDKEMMISAGVSLLVAAIFSFFGLLLLRKKK